MEFWVLPFYSNLFPSGDYIIQSLQLMSASCCTGRYRQTNKFIIIYFMTELFQKDLIESDHFA